MAVKKEGRLLSIILDYGKELLMAGEEVWRVEETLSEICEAYAYKKHEIWVVSSCIQATVQTNDGRIYTQIRSVPGDRFDVDRLCRLKELSEEICTRRMGVDTFRTRLDEILEVPTVPRKVKYLASAMAVSGFAVFFDGDAVDVVIAGVIALIMAVLGENIGRRESNPLIYNSIVAFVMELLTIFSIMADVGHHSDTITSAALLLLISGLGITNGIKDVMHRNTLSGLSTIANAILGAAGIAIGISLAMYLFRDVFYQHLEMQDLIADPLLQILSCTIGCMGFAIMFNAKGRIMVYSGIGAAATWVIYLLVSTRLGADYFVSTIVASCFVAFYANALTKIKKIPAAALLITCVFPLVPGSTLYFTVYATILNQTAMLSEQSRKLMLICIAIALGYIIIEVLYRNSQAIKNAIVRKLRG